MSSNIFGGGDEKNQTKFKEQVDTHSKAILTVVEKQKTLENSMDLLGEKIELIDHNAIKNFKKLFNEIKDLKSKMRDLKHDISSLKEYDNKVQKQLRLTTTKDEVQKLEKYIDLWDPMGFVTREELEENSQKTIKELRKIIEEFMK